MKKFFLFLLTFVCSVGMVCGETLASFSNASNDGWLISGSPAYSNSGGYQLVASSMLIMSPSISFSDYKDITITITARKYGGPNATQGKISVKLGSTSGTELATYSPGSTTLTASGKLSISPASNGSLVIYCPGASSSKGCGISSIVIEGTKKTTETFTVTFDAGTNGTCLTSSLTETSAGAGVTLPACTANDGYKFLGWTETEGKTTVDDGLTATATYKPTKNITLYAVYAQLFQVTIEEPANGSLSVKCGEADVTSGDYLAVGEILNIVATPATGYKFRNIEVVAATTYTYTSSNTKTWTMGAHAITIKANFDAIVYHTITWSVNGNITAIAPSQVEDGVNITFPTNLADILDKKFVGWSTNSAANSASDLVSGDVAASETTSIFYAVYADVTPGDRETAKLTITDNESVSYTNGLTRADDKGNNWVSYACISNQTSNKVTYWMIQINKSSNGYHIGSPNFGANISAISAKVWNTNSSDRYAYLKANTNTKQPSISDYGTTTIPGNSKGDVVDFTINSNAEFSQFYIYVSGAVGFEYIEVTYGLPDTYNNYTTTIPTITLEEACTDGEKSYCTFSSACAFVVPEYLTVSVVAVNEAGVLTVEEYKTGDVVAANTGVMVSGTAGNYPIELTNEAASEIPGGNNLHPSSEAMTGDNLFYRLTMHNGTQIGFYWGAEDGAAFEIAAGKAYLAVPASAEINNKLWFAETETDEGIATDLEMLAPQADAPIYDLMGRRVAAPAPGHIYIRDGVKYLAK